ncbi:hypothetical protein, partial [Propionivibrio sp.]|uniref:hypothetical protein n=1 Tax=Propionivibrio sp. TaxID=2212460 RepID=UPI00261976BF
MSEQQFSTAAFNWVTSEKSTIQQVANTLGVSAMAIAGLMAKERTAYDESFAKLIVNSIQDSLIPTMTDIEIRADYRMVNALGWANDKVGASKAVFSTLNDIGYANIKLQTAIRVLEDYKQNYIDKGSDPLALSSYASDYGKLARDLAGNVPSIAPKILGLVAVEADKFYVDHSASTDYMNGLSQAKRDGLTVTSMVFGPKTMERLYQENTSVEQGHPGIYKPGLGRGDGGGNAFVAPENVAPLAQIFGIDSASYSAGGAANVEPSQIAAPESGLGVIMRPSSSALIDYVDSHTAVLKKDGTLSDIVLIENKNGNPITADDLIKINGLLPGQELKLQIGQQIFVPQKVGNNLVVDYGNVRLSMNPADGTYQYLINDPQANTTTLITRSLDATQSSGYTDRYVKTDNASGLELESFVNGVDASYGYQFNNGQATTNAFTVTTTTTLSPSQTTTPDPTQSISANTSTLITTGTSQVDGLGDVNTATGNTAYANNLITGGIRPGEQNLVNEILGSQLAENFLANPNLVNSPVWAPDVNAVAMNILATGVQYTIPTDP